MKNAPALALAALLQIAPLCRVASLATAAAPSNLAVVFQWIAGAAILLGGYDAVSAPSAAITGFAPVNPVTLVPIGRVTTNGVATVGTNIAYRIVVTNPGVNNADAFYGASGLPPGLTINTNFGQPGVIVGAPTASGYYPVLLWAGNSKSTTIVYLNANFNVGGGGVAPPALTGEPASQTVAEGGTATFTSSATGTGLGFQWLFNSNALPGQVDSALVLSNVTTAQAGYYAVTVSNAGGTVTSSNALLTVLSAVPPAPVITLDPTNQIVPSGGTIDLVVAASGSPVSYTWYYNSNVVAGVSGPVLVLTNAGVAQSGFYFAEAGNAGGTNQSASARVLVVPPPSASQAGDLGFFKAPAGQLTLSFTTSPGYSFFLQSSSDLASTNWVTVTNLTPAFDPVPVSLGFDFAGAPRQFFRIAVEAGP
jgi:hypothetical protein